MIDFLENFILILKGVWIKFFPCFLGVCVGFTFITPILTKVSFNWLRFPAALISCGITTFIFALIVSIIGPFLDKE